MLEEVVEEVCHSRPDQFCSDNQNSRPDSGALVTTPRDPAWSWNSHQAVTGLPSRQQQPSYTLPSLVLSSRVERPIYWMPQSDGAGDQSSEELSVFSQRGLSRLLSMEDDADSQHLVMGQLQVIQPHHPHMVFIFLAKMQALMARRRHQHGAVAESPALDGRTGRMWQRAVLASFARSEGFTCSFSPCCQANTPTPVCFCFNNTGHL